MRRTYKSKKDTGGGVDLRDMVMSVDSKSSMFDAYYIQNIKQVKREMSCVSSFNPYTAASNKVRKRKYVKRLKEPEPIRESLSESAYLTPDKSIHVNRGHDLFDQLLNSSTNVPTPKSSRNSVKKLSQEQVQVPKRTYYKKKHTKTKRVNVSSSEGTDSDKENSLDNKSDLSHNISNVKAHRLVIEKEKVSNKIYLDESINNIVTKLPVLNKLSKGNIRESSNRTSTFSNIQFNVSHSPVLQSSPQCSTPFYEKYRGKSIYNFSPINIDLMNEFRMFHSIHENINNNSVVHVEKDEPSQLPDSKLSCNSITERSISKLEGKNSESYELQEKMPSVELQKTIFTSFEKERINMTTELEPFLGFTSSSIQNAKSDRFEKHTEVRSSASNCSTDSNHIDNNFHNTESLREKLNSQEPNIVIDDLNTSSKSTICSTNDNDLHTKENIKKSVSYESLGNESLINGNCVNDNILYIESIREECKGHPSFVADNLITSSESSIYSINGTNFHIEEKSNDTSVISESVENESLYNTCDSDNISDTSSSDKEEPKEPVVIMERMNDSLFQKYYEKMANYSLDSNTSNKISDNISDTSSTIDEKEYANFKDLDSEGDVSENSSNNDNINPNIDMADLEIFHVQVISSSENSDSNEIEEDGGLSFVTTRRRNEITNNSFVMNIDNSYSSNSSSTLDKTVVNNNEKTDIAVDNTVVNKSIEHYTAKTDSEIEDSECVTDLVENSILPSKDYFTAIVGPVHTDVDENYTNVNTRKSSKLFGASTCRSSQVHANETNTLKHGIVLKPGKQWERSLSIYRRLTTVGDIFNYSILEDESVKTKGRKYRQSVISTMEMQEYQGSLHNESVFSRRSTFTSKPSRTSIKIFKDPNATSVDLSSSVLYDDLQGFLNGDCDDTIIELSKLSIGDCEVSCLDKFHDTSNRIATARDYVLRRCNQTDPILFDECYPDTVLKNCRKIGEGVYGEVYLFRAGDGRARVMKIVPIAGATKVNGEQQKDFHEIISEIVIAMELSALRAPIAGIERQLDDGKEIDASELQSIQNATDVFNEVIAVRCVYGAYPSRLLDLWELYDETRGSENDNPAVLPSDQQYLVLELANAGQDLESYQFTNAEQAYALFKQIALGLAVAEEAFQFEHRDLHWGNVLIAPTDQKTASFVIRGRLYRAARCGVAATLIDYSLSRAARDGRALYNDLADDDALFDAVGDYQFEVYRLMRDKLCNDWKNYEPYTNVLWLHYTVDKMITALRYQRTNTKIHKNYIAKLKEIKNRILDYGSATQFVLTDNEF